MNRIALFLLILAVLGSCKTSPNKTTPMSTVNKQQSLFHQGVRNYITGNNKKAILDFEACIKTNALDDASHFALAQLYLIESQLDQAAYHSEIAAKLDPNNSYYASELAYMYAEMKQYKKAGEFFEDLVSKDKNNIAYYMGAINNYANALEYAKAMKILDKLIEHRGLDISLQMEKYDLFLLMKKPEKALKTLEEGRVLFDNDPIFIATLVDSYMQNKQFDEAFTLLNELVEKDTENGLATLLLGEMYMQKKNYLKGLELLKSAVTKEGPSIDQKMNILIQTQKTEGCGPEITKLVDYMTARYPENAKSYAIKGDCCIKNNDVEGAIIAYKKAVGIQPGLFPVWQQLLLLEFQSEKWTSLYKNSIDAISLFPNNPFVYLTAGIAANKIQNYGDAIGFLEAGLEYIIKNDETEAEMLAQLGEANFGLKKPDIAYNFYNRAILKYPNSAPINAAFALQLAKNKLKLDFAITLIDISLSKAPDNALYMAIKGTVLLMKQSFTDALQIIGEAKKIDAKNPVIIDWMGDAYYFSGKVDAAVEEWKVAQILGSKNDVLPQKILDKKYYAPSN
jgi:pentatricopeptide repeat protein